MADLHKHEYCHEYLDYMEIGAISKFLQFINRKGYEIVAIFRDRGDGMFFFYDKNPREKGELNG